MHFKCRRQLPKSFLHRCHDRRGEGGFGLPTGRSRTDRLWRLFYGGLLCTTGCFHPLSLRLPTFQNRPPEVERVEYQYHDPFPDSQIGPNTGVRPREYTNQRPLPVNIRDKYDGTRILQPSGADVPPPVGSPPGSEYPQVVPF